MTQNNKNNSPLAFLVLLLVLIGSFSIFIYYARNSCQRIRTFSVGSVDSRFNISKSQVEAVAKDAANRWNGQTGENLLQYDENSTLKINLVYDDRQAQVDKLNLANKNLQQNLQNVDTSKEKFNQLLAAFQADLAKYNSDVTYWNNRGGAPADVYAQLQTTSKSLDQRRSDLISMSQTLNIQVSNYNSDLNNLKTEVDSQKNVIITQGLYEPAQNQIEVFTFGSSNELRLVLMHELGHELGLEHDQNTTSIMYYLLGNQSLDDPKLTPEDKQELDSRCDVRNIQFYKNIFQNIAQS